MSLSACAAALSEQPEVLDAGERVSGKQEHRQAEQRDERLGGVSSPFQLVAERYIECT